MPMEKVINQCTVVLTRDCNLRCSFCYAKRAGYSVVDRIACDDLKTIVDFCYEAKVKYLVFTGGEPLLYPDLSEILQYIKSKNPDMVVAIPTNGLLLEDIALCEKLIREGVGYFDLSIKGNSPRKWQTATGYDGYNKQLQAIRNLSSFSVEFTCSMVITAENVMTFCDAVQAAYDNGAKQFSFTFMIDNASSEEKGIKYLEKHDPFYLAEAFLMQMDRLNAITDDWWIEYSFPICIYSKEQLAQLKGRLASPCQIHMKNSITFNTKMELLPCDMFIEQKIGKLGKDFSSAKEFFEYIKQPAYQHIMNPLQKMPSDECKSCAHLQSCYGGCPVLWKNYSFDDLQNFQKNQRNN